MAIALGLIIAIILLKYKPSYKVTLLGQKIGYVDNEAELEERIQQEIIKRLFNYHKEFVEIDIVDNE